MLWFSKCYLGLGRYDADMSFTLKTLSTYSNYLQTSDAIFSFFAPSDFNEDDFYFSNYLQLLDNSRNKQRNKWQQIIQFMQITYLQAEVQDGKYILLAILKGFLWVYT